MSGEHFLTEDGRYVAWRFEGELLRANHYLVLDKQNDKMFAVDTGFGKPAIDEIMKITGSKLSAIYLTHGHFDHAGGAAYLAEKYSCPIFLRSDDFRTLRSSNFLLKVFGYEITMQTPKVELVAENFIDEAVRFLDCPGHTPGSVVIQIGGFLFTGDSVYADRVDAVKLPDQNDENLYSSIRRILSDLVNAERIFPGHGIDIRGADLLSSNLDLSMKLNQK